MKFSMNAKKTVLGLALAAAISVPALAADTSDMWLTTKAKIALLTTDGRRRRRRPPSPCGASMASRA